MIDIALFRELEKDDVEALKVAIKNGLDIHADDEYLFRHCAYDGRIKLVEYLFQNGVNVHAKKDDALEYCARNGQTKIIKYLHENGVNVFVKDGAILGWAAFFGHLETVKYMIEIGADVHELDDFAIRFSALNHHLDVVAYLIDCGANFRVAGDDPLLSNMSLGWPTLSKFLLSKYDPDIKYNIQFEKVHPNCFSLMSEFCMDSKATILRLRKEFK